MGFSGEHCENSKYSTKEFDTVCGRQLSTSIITFALSLLNFSVDLDDCVNHNCFNGASCIDGINGYSCYCSVGFSGEHCENSKYSTKEIDTASSRQLSTSIITLALSLLNFSVDLDDCVNHNCSNGASCIDGINGYSCNCSVGFSGEHCENSKYSTKEIDTASSRQLSTSIITFALSLLNFSVDLDDCVNHNCSNGASCIDGINGYSCNCSVGFSGEHCENSKYSTKEIDTASSRHFSTSIITFALSLLNFSVDLDDCVNHNCSNGASCIGGINGYSCNCSVGFSGEHCENSKYSTKEIDTASSRQLSTSIITFALSLLNFSVDLDDCVNHNCSNGASCIDGINGYSCNCSVGFSGEHCENSKYSTREIDTASSRRLSTSIITFALSLLNFSVDLDDCVNHNCSNGAPCIDGINGYSCNCSVGFSGEHCENSKYSTKEIDTASSRQLSTSIITFALSLLNFSVDLDDCVNHNCSNGASCIDGINGYSCNCSVGFSGEHCENSKYSTREIDTASSRRLSTSIITFALSLLNFSVDLDDCVNHNCSNGAPCIDGINGYSCNCSVGFSGEHCENSKYSTKEIDTASSRHFSTSIITFALSLLNFSVDLDDCVNHNCSNGASCIDGINGYSCNCSVGFSGEHCENSKYSTKEIDTASSRQLSTSIITFALSLLNFSVDLDDCVNHNCSNGASCIDGINGYSCNCSVGFSGEHCENSKYSTKEIDTASSRHFSTSIITFALSLLNFSVDLDDCVNHNCSNGASCIGGINGYSCNCSVGFSGEHCENSKYSTKEIDTASSRQLSTSIITFALSLLNFSVDLDDCVNHICSNGASCIDGINGYSCNCSVGFSGEHCENSKYSTKEFDTASSRRLSTSIITFALSLLNFSVDLDDCVNHNCSNGASCIDGINGYSCNCSVRFPGEHCENSKYSTKEIDTASSRQLSTSIITFALSLLNFSVDLDDCVNHNCSNGASCIGGISGYSCNCSVGFSGEHCENSKYSTKEIDTASSRQLSTSIITFALSLLNFSVDLDDCVNHNCSNGASCIGGISGYSCNCSVGFSGEHCENSKYSTKEIDTASSRQLSTSIITFALSLLNFSVDLDDCVNHNCSNGASCIDGINRYSCNCSVGFSGEHCENSKYSTKEIDTASSRHFSTSIITFALSLLNFSVDLDDCVNHNCSNGASCIDGINGYSCNCSVGFPGEHCENSKYSTKEIDTASSRHFSTSIITFALSLLNFSVDLDDCVNHNCSNGASCIDGINGYSCNCSVGFPGEHCENSKYSTKEIDTASSRHFSTSIITFALSLLNFFVDLDDCVNHNCSNGASCIDGINGYSCNCSVGFSGEHCENSKYSTKEIDTASSRRLSTSIITFALSLLNFSVDLDDRVNHNCSNGASCIDGINGYSCNCSVGFSGEHCENSKYSTKEVDTGSSRQL